MSAARGGINRCQMFEKRCTASARVVLIDMPESEMGGFVVFHMGLRCITDLAGQDVHLVLFVLLPGGRYLGALVPVRVSLRRIAAAATHLAGRTWALHCGRREPRRDLRRRLRCRIIDGGPCRLRDYANGKVGVTMLRAGL